MKRWVQHSLNDKGWATVSYGGCEVCKNAKISRLTLVMCDKHPQESHKICLRCLGKAVDNGFLKAGEDPGEFLSAGVCLLDKEILVAMEFVNEPT